MHVHVEQDLGVLVEGPERHVPVRVGHGDLREEALGADRPHVRDAVGPMFVLSFYLTLGYCLANFERPVLGCIEADVCK